MENRLFVAYKPPFIPSNFYLNRLKRRLRFKSGGFSGTLDPFAKGSLLIATGQYSKLFRFFKKTPKIYRATIWLGASSETLDIDGVTSIKTYPPFEVDDIKKHLDSLIGEVEFTPPKFSAKKIDGVRAYKLVRSNREFELSKTTMDIFDIKLLLYNHPFLSIEVTCGEGSYIRSLGELLSKKLGVNSALSSLERIKEGEFEYNNEKPLDPLHFLDLKQNFATHTKGEIEVGKKLKSEHMKYKDDGFYYLDYDDFFTIVEVVGENVKYVLNRINKC